MILNKF